MTYRIDLSSTAKAEADAAFLSYSKFTEPKRAQEWYQGLLAAVASLQEMPRRCAIARENSFFTQEIRQLIYGKGKSTYRIIFTILDDHPIETVRILHIRNSAQQTIGESNE